MAMIIGMPGLAGPMPFVGNGRIRSVDEMYATKKSLDVQMWKAEERKKLLAHNGKESWLNCKKELGRMQRKLQNLKKEACFEPLTDHGNQALVSVLKEKDLLLQFMHTNLNFKKLNFKELDITFFPSYKKKEETGRFNLLKESKSFQDKRKDLIKSVIKKARIGQPPFQNVVKIMPASDSPSNNDTPGVKGRLPGYADRVLVRNSSDRMSDYRVLEVMGSDHSPVSVRVQHFHTNVKQPIIEIITFNTGGNVQAVDEILEHVKESSADNICTILCLQEINASLHKRVINSPKIKLFGEISSNWSKIPHNFRLGVYCTIEGAITEPQTKRFNMFSMLNPRAHTKGFMYVTCNLYKKKIKVLNLHAPFKSEDQSHKSWNELFNFVAEKIRTETEKWTHVVMCGDFNSRSVFEKLEKDVTYCNTA